VFETGAFSTKKGFYKKNNSSACFAFVVAVDAKALAIKDQLTEPTWNDITISQMTGEMYIKSLCSDWQLEY
jgi:hypothetical protein